MISSGDLEKVDQILQSWSQSATKSIRDAASIIRLELQYGPAWTRVWYELNQVIHNCADSLVKLHTQERDRVATSYIRDAAILKDLFRQAAQTGGRWE